jgi:hypothetical protein
MRFWLICRAILKIFMPNIKVFKPILEASLRNSTDAKGIMDHIDEFAAVRGFTADMIKYQPAKPIMYYRNSDGDMVEAPVDYQRSEYEPSDFDLKTIFLNGIKRPEYIPTKEMQQAQLDHTTIDAVITVFRLRALWQRRE